MASANLDVKFQLTATVLAPGDTLVVGLSRRLTAQEYDELVGGIGAALPGVKVALIENCSGLATYHPEPDEPDLPTLT